MAIGRMILYEIKLVHMQVLPQFTDISTKSMYTGLPGTPNKMFLNYLHLKRLQKMFFIIIKGFFL